MKISPQGLRGVFDAQGKAGLGSAVAGVRVSGDDAAIGQAEAGCFRSHSSTFRFRVG